ncbi:hypothetical protein [Parachlamydia sp. AcF125]|uniref:hypothetical protein n=1 Tax=Parachlamydia sp. AcF125 TaxID=2795736 RepID=UPI001BC96E6A|nr:hypothetical protein [Parachlamydia sp. AcF125]MBS4168041.1 hypothetical protein [Parachlamydia sp. AcF125]
MEPTPSYSSSGQNYSEYQQRENQETPPGQTSLPTSVPGALNTGSSGGTPYAEGAQLHEAVTMHRLQIATPEPHLAKQIEILNNVMEQGILTKRRSAALGISIIQSADKNEANNDSLCLNYIHAAKGITTSLTHEAKGGFPVVLERTEDPLEKDVQSFSTASSNPEFLQRLSERAHASILFVLPVNKKEGSENTMQY